MRVNIQFEGFLTSDSVRKLRQLPVESQEFDPAYSNAWALLPVFTRLGASIRLITELPVEVIEAWFKRNNVNCEYLFVSKEDARGLCIGTGTKGLESWYQNDPI